VCLSSCRATITLLLGRQLQQAENIPVTRLKDTSKGKNYTCLCVKGTTLGREGKYDESLVLPTQMGILTWWGKGFPIIMMDRMCMREIRKGKL